MNDITYSDEELDDALEALSELGDSRSKWLECNRCRATYRFNVVKRLKYCPSCGSNVDWMLLYLG